MEAGIVFECVHFTYVSVQTQEKSETFLQFHMTGKGKSQSRKAKHQAMWEKVRKPKGGK